MPQSTARQRRVLANDPELDRLIRLGKVIATVAGCAVCVPLGCAVSAWIVGHGFAWLPARDWVTFAQNIKAAPGQPATWYPPQAGLRPPGIAWFTWAIIAVFALGVLTLSGWVGHRLWGVNRNAGDAIFRSAMADDRDVKRFTAKALHKKRAFIRPDLKWTVPWRREDTDAGLYVGRVISK